MEPDGNGNVNGNGNDIFTVYLYTMEISVIKLSGNEYYRLYESVVLKS